MNSNEKSEYHGPSSRFWPAKSALDTYSNLKNAQYIFTYTWFFTKYSSQENPKVPCHDMLHPMKKTPTSLYGPKPNSKNIQLVFASTYILWVLYYLLVLYTKVFADIINTRLTPVNFLSSNSVREIDLLFLYRMIMISIL